MKVALSFITIGEGKKMLGIQKIVCKSTMLPISHFAINVSHMNGITLLKMEISIYYVMNALGSSRKKRDGWYKRYREGTIVNHSFSQIFKQSFCRLYYYKHYYGNKLFE